MKIAKQYVKKYRSFFIIGCIAFLALWLVLFNFVFQKSLLALLFAYALLALAVFVLKFYAANKWLKGPLLNDLNAPLYYEIITTGKFYDRTAFAYLQAEYFVGNYDNVIAICNQKIGKARTPKKHYYTYVTYLANVCYNIGDRESLQKICQQVKGFLSNEKPKTRKRLARFLKRLQFYDDYLGENWDACNKFLLENAGVTTLSHITNFYDRAHVALAKGELDQAKIFFQEVQKAPLLCYANHATHALEAIETGRPYNEGIEPVSENKEYTLKPFPKKLKVLYSLLLILCVVSLLLNEFPSFGSVTKYQRDICKAVEEDYDDAKVLKTFNLMYGDELAESMVVCEVYEGLLLASVYTYEGDDQIYYHKQSLITAHELKNDKVKTKYSYFTCFSSDKRAGIAFCTKKSDIPKDALYSFSVKAHGKTVYISVASVGEEFPFS